MRIYAPERIKLSRRVETVETQFGPVRMKHASGFGIEKCKPEYDDVARIASERGMTVAEVRSKLAEENK